MLSRADINLLQRITPSESHSSLALPDTKDPPPPHPHPMKLGLFSENRDFEPTKAQQGVLWSK